MLTRERLPAALLALILLVAFGLRVWSLGHGLPYSYNLDERAHFVPHAVAMTGGDLNPGYFINPPFLTYMLALWLSIVHLGGVEQWFADDPGGVFLAGRWIAVFFGVGTVAATYFAGRAWFDRRVGLVAAAIIAVAFLPVFYSRLALNDGPGILPCALALWATAVVLRTGSHRALLAGGACVGLAASFKYSDGAIVFALIAAAFLSPLGWREALKWLVARRRDRDRHGDRHQPVPVRRLGHVHPRPQPPAQVRLRRRRCSASRSATAGGTTCSSARWALGVVPSVLAVIGGIALIVKGKRREAAVLGSLVVLYWLYMGSQIALLRALDAAAVPRAGDPRRVRASRSCGRRSRSPRWSRWCSIPTVIPTIRNAIVMGREDTRSQTRDWLVANVPAGTKVAFEPIAPSEWYGVTPGGGREGRPAASSGSASTAPRRRSPSSPQSYRGALRPANFQNYERTLTPALIDVYRREGVCWHVSGSTQYGRAQAEPKRAPEALKFYRALQAAGRRRVRDLTGRAGSCRATRSTSRSTTSTAPTTGPGPR